MTRVLFLRLPLWTTFHLSAGLFVWENLPWLVFNGIVTLVFTALALWLFVNIKFENRHKKWFLWVFGSKEWQPLMQAMEMLDELKKFKLS